MLSLPLSLKGPVCNLRFGHMSYAIHPDGAPNPRPVIPETFFLFSAPYGGT